MTVYSIGAKAPLIRIILITGAFLLFMPQSGAQYHFDENCQQTYKAIISLRFAEARRLIDLERKVDRTNLLPLYFENYIDFLTLIIGEDRQLFDALKEGKTDRIEKLENGQRDSPFYNYCLAEVYIQWAFARLKFGDYTTAAFEIRKAHALFSDNEKKYPSFIVNKIGIGLVHVVVGLVPDNYKWLTTLIGLDGSVESGLGEIKQVAEYSGNDKTANLYKTEALFYLAFLEANLQKNKKDALSVIGLLKNQPDEVSSMKSPLLIFANASILMKNGHNDEALAELQRRTSCNECYPFYYLDFLEGMARLNKLDFSASLFYEKFTRNYKGQSYIRSAYQKLAWIALLRGDTATYRLNMKLVKIKGSALVDEDKQGTIESVNNIFPNGVLLRARLLFDGGYYSRALNELHDNTGKSFIKTKRDLVEYNYRLGRIYHETGAFLKALEYYRITIQLGREEPYYFAASAAFQTGLLYENAGAWMKADSAYRLCLSINTPEYKTSLGQKAKAGLIRVKKKAPKT